MHFIETAYPKNPKPLSTLSYYDKMHVQDARESRIATKSTIVDNLAVSAINFFIKTFPYILVK